MAYTYMDIVNDVLGETNEVLLTEDNFLDATNVQRTVKEFANRAYFDLNNPVNKWPWLAVGPPLENYYGNAYIETAEGDKWYMMNPDSAGFNSDYGFIEWNHMLVTTRGVSGEEAPWDARRLKYIEPIEYNQHYGTREARDQDESASYEMPKRVVRSPDNRRFGLSPTPDKIYRVYFWAYTRPVALVQWNDQIAIPDQYYPVLVSRTRYYAWQRKENPAQAQIALEEYNRGLSQMRLQEIGNGPDAVTDDRVRWV